MNIFKGDELFSLGAIEAILKCSRNTLYYWIFDGILVTIVKNGRPIKSRVKLPARKVAGRYMSFGHEINEFLKYTGQGAA